MLDGDSGINSAHILTPRFAAHKKIEAGPALEGNSKSEG
jgi:hypothetical protein